MNPKTHEALIRALPYLSEKRREVVVGFLLTKVFDVPKWFFKENCLGTPVALLNADVYLLILSVQDNLSYQLANATRLNKTIDKHELTTRTKAHEPRNP